MNGSLGKRFSRYRIVLISLILFSVLMSLSLSQQTAESASTVLPQSSTDKQVMVTVTVTDKQGRPVSNLPKSSFAVFDEKVPQDITFFSDTDGPLSVAIVFDLSRSMTTNTRRITMAKKGLARFVGLSHELNEYLILSFDKQPHIVADTTRDPSLVLNTLSGLNPTQRIIGSALYDTCYVAIDKLIQSSHAKRVILLISDGQDSDSRHRYLDMRRYLQQSGVVVYSIGIIEANDELNSFGREVLNEISRLSGGRAYFPVTEAEMDERFENIAAELRQQYLIGFKSSSVTKDGKIRKIRVNVMSSDKQQKLQVRAREGYIGGKGE